MLNKESFSWELYNRAPIVGIVRGVSMEVIRDIAKAYLKEGLHTIEITMNTAGATEMISKLRSEFNDLNVGAGTVCNMEEYEKAVAAGAQFIVTPIIDEVVIKRAVAKGIPIFPGAYSPTEIYRAWSLGASAVKIFPATQLGGVGMGSSLFNKKLIRERDFEALAVHFSKIRAEVKGF